MIHNVIIVYIIGTYIYIYSCITFMHHASWSFMILFQLKMQTQYYSSGKMSSRPYVCIYKINICQYVLLFKYNSLMQSATFTAYKQVTRISTFILWMFKDSTCVLYFEHLKQPFCFVLFRNYSTATFRCKNNLEAKNIFK